MWLKKHTFKVKDKSIEPPRPIDSSERGKLSYYHYGGGFVVAKNDLIIRQSDTFALLKNVYSP